MQQKRTTTQRGLHKVHHYSAHTASGSPGLQGGGRGLMCHPVTSGADRRLMGGSRAQGSDGHSFSVTRKAEQTHGGREAGGPGPRPAEPEARSSSGLCDLEPGAGALAGGEGDRRLL